MSKPTKTSAAEKKEEERKAKTDLFKKLFLEQEEDLEDSDSKAEMFAKLVAGKGKSKPSNNRPSRAPQPSSFDEMKDFMRDPFGSKEWAASRQYKRREQPEMIEMVIAEPTEEELQAFWASRPADD